MARSLRSARRAKGCSASMPPGLPEQSVNDNPAGAAFGCFPALASKRIAHLLTGPGCIFQAI